MPRKAEKKRVSAKAEVRYERRRTAIDALNRGEHIEDVARVMNIPHRTLFEWISRYRHGGEHALRDGAKSGRPRKADVKVLEWLYETITMGDPRQYQLPYVLWTLGIVRRLLKQVHGIEISKSVIDFKTAVA